jgi:hypothetical protein
MGANGREIQRLKRKVKTLVGRLSAAEELADEVNCEISRLSREPVDGRARKAPRRFAESLKATPLADGSCRVSIDGSEPVRLSSRLWRFLSIIAEEKAGNSPDDCVGWKRKTEVRAKLGKEFGEKVSLHSLANLTWRLRAALGTKRGDLVQTHRADGLIRFALRRAAPTQVVISAGGL